MSNPTDLPVIPNATPAGEAGTGTVPCNWISVERGKCTLLYGHEGPHCWEHEAVSWQ